jgi:hypothetical protein
MKRKGGPADVTARVQRVQSGASAARTGESSASRPVGREQPGASHGPKLNLGSKIALSAFAGLALLLVGFTYGSAVRSLDNEEGFLRDVEALQVGQSTLEDVEVIQQRRGSVLMNPDREACRTLRCSCLLFPPAGGNPLTRWVRQIERQRRAKFGKSSDALRRLPNVVGASLEIKGGRVSQVRWMDVMTAPGSSQ